MGGSGKKTDDRRVITQSGPTADGLTDLARLSQLEIDDDWL